MPLVVPEYIEIRTAAGATAAYLSPESDGLKDAVMERELNGRSTLTFSLPILPGSGADVPVLTVKGVMPTVDVPDPNDKWQYITDQYRIYAPDITGQMREFVIQNPDAIEKDRNDKKLWGKVTAHESWVLLGKRYVTVSNDPQTPDPPWAAVIILSGGSDLSGGLYPVGSAAHALYAILQGTGWSIGTVDVEGTHDLETEKISVLENINKIQEIWGGYLAWDSINKTVSLRSETSWVPYTGYQIRYAKNLKGITRTSDFDIITKLYPFGENDLNIGSVNNGQIYIEDHSYTDEVLEGIWVNQDIADPQKLKDEATKYLAKVCKPRHNYRISQVDLRLLSGYQHEDFDLGHMVDVVDEELGVNVKARIISYRFNIFQPWKDSEIEVGDPIEKIESMLADSREMVRYLNSIRTSKGEITAYKLVNESIIAEKIAKSAIDASKINVGLIFLSGDSWTDNTPSAGYVSWNQHKVYWNGTEHVITAGNTNQKYVYWDNQANSYSASATLPDLTDAGFIIAVNNGGLHELVWNQSVAKKLVGSEMLEDGAVTTTKIANAAVGSAAIANAAIVNAHIADGTIQTAKIADAAITDAKIANLNANKINVTDLTALSSEDGYTKMQGDGVRVYDEAGNLMGHMGRFSGLGTQVATFTRSSVAYKQDGTQVAAGVPRFEYIPFPAPVWQDTFDIDQLSQYTSGGDSPATWAVSGGVLTATGGTEAYLIKNDLLIKDCDIVITTDQAARGAIKARYQDANNNYFLSFYDNTEGGGTGFINIAKRVNGVNSQIVGANINFPRGTPATVKFSLHGSTLEAYFNGVKVLSCTDTTFTGGMVGLRQNAITAGTSTRFLDFTVYYAQQGVMVEEGCTNIVASWPAGWTAFGNPSMAAVDMSAQPGAAGSTVRLTNGSATEGYYGSPNFALNPSTTYTLKFKARGTVGPAAFDVYVLSYTGTLAQGVMRQIPLTGAFQEYSLTFTTSADITGANQSIRFDHNGNDAGYIEIAEVSLIQKPYALSFPGYGATRAVEVLTVPTAGVFQKGNWTVELVYTPSFVPPASGGAIYYLWIIFIDASNYYGIRLVNSQFQFLVVSGGVAKVLTSTLNPAVTVNTPYNLMFSGNGSVLRACVNGVQVGSDLAYTEPVGSLPAEMRIGNYANAYQANGILSNFRVSSRARTLAEHQAEYNTGLPLSLDNATTYLMSCDGHLQPTVRRFGLWAKNGQIILQNPAAGQGLEVWDGATRKVLIGRLDDGTIGQEIVGGKLYSSSIRSGGKTDTSYIQLNPGNEPLEVVQNNKLALDIWTYGNGGAIQFYDAALDDMCGQIAAVNDAYGQQIRIQGRNRAGSSKNVVVDGYMIYLLTDTQVYVDGDLSVSGGLDVSGLPKNAIEETSQGRVALAARESPDIRYLDEFKAQLVNGECRIDLDILRECVEPDRDISPWVIHLTPTAPEILYVAEVGDYYFVVKSSDPASDNSFYWQLSAIRKGFAGQRFQLDRFADDVLTSNWEDEYGEHTEAIQMEPGEEGNSGDTGDPA